MQEVKVEVIPNNVGASAKVLKLYIQQGYHIDAFVIEANANTVYATLTIVMSKERTGQWN